MLSQVQDGLECLLITYYFMAAKNVNTVNTVELSNSIHAGSFHDHKKETVLHYKQSTWENSKTSKILKGHKQSAVPCLQYLETTGRGSK